MKKFLLITSRTNEEILQPELAAYRELTGLGDTGLEWHRVERDFLAGINPHDYAGIILGGSPFTISVANSLKDELELKVEKALAGLLDTVVAADIPFLGICYGIGTLGSHQGATIDMRYGETARAANIRLTAAGKTDQLFAQMPHEFDAYVGHKEAVSVPSPAMTVLAGSLDCPVQAFRVGQNVYAVQFHPELRSQDFVNRLRLYANHGYFDPTRFDDLCDHVFAADVAASHQILRRFVEIYSDGAGE
ncbi:MAG: glutamine amidotransferase [Microbacteriaceae bacterium]|nr:glutamine amidotransferase [Microbacteriaceae bacterium]